MHGRNHVRRRVGQAGANVPAHLAVRIDTLALERDLRAHDEVALHLVVGIVHLVIRIPGVLAGRAHAVVLQLVVVGEGASAFDRADVLVGGKLANRCGKGEGGRGQQGERRQQSLERFDHCVSRREFLVIDGATKGWSDMLAVRSSGTCLASKAMVAVYLPAKMNGHADRVERQLR